MGVRRAFQLRASCAMSQVVALPLVLSLGASNVVEGSLVRWPSGVVLADGSAYISNVRVSVRYDEGLVAEVEFVHGEPCLASSDAIEAAMRASVAAWEKALTPKTAPFSPILSDLFDRLWLMGEPVTLAHPSGRPIMAGTLCGIDVWGRVTVRGEDGAEVEVAPEQAQVLPR